MSYEGYIEQLCSKGHYTTADAYDKDDKCWVCKSEIVWTNNVDQTNDNGYPFGEARLKVKTEQAKHKCPTCGHERVSARTTYHMPTDNDMRQYYEYYEDLEDHYAELRMEEEYEDF